MLNNNCNARSQSNFGVIELRFDALGALPTQQREAVVLTKLEGKSVAEAATIAGTTVGAMKVRAHRGYEALRKLLTGAKKESAA